MFLKYTRFASIVALAGMAGGHAASQMFKPTKELTVAQITRAYDGSGTLIGQTEELLAFRADGATVLAVRIPAFEKEPGYHARTVSVPATGTKTHVVDKVRAKYTKIVPEPTLRVLFENGRARRAANCVDPLTKTQQTFAGYVDLAPGIRASKIVEANARATITTFRVKEYDCAEFASEWVFSNLEGSGYRRSVKSIVLEGLKEGSPDPTLFEIDPTFDEVLPAELDKRVLDHARGDARPRP